MNWELKKLNGYHKKNPKVFKAYWLHCQELKATENQTVTRSF
jgi:hypothetical protein